jgi:hypothetical protein
VSKSRKLRKIRHLRPLLTRYDQNSGSNLKRSSNYHKSVIYLHNNHLHRIISYLVNSPSDLIKRISSYMRFKVLTAANMKIAVSGILRRVVW